MTRCEEILVDGTQCTKQAVTGSRFCKEHVKRIVFRPVSPPPLPTKQAVTTRSEMPSVPAAKAPPQSLIPVLPKVFMSHSHEDNDLCNQYASALRAQGVDLYYDEYTRTRGNLLAEEIER